MRSVTSCFNSTLYSKTMKRFWPVWTIYGLIWLFPLPLSLLTVHAYHTRLEDRDAVLLGMASNLPSYLRFGVFLSLVFGLFAAMAVFGYLYSGRSTCWFHALPLRRETLFVTQYLAGLCFLLLPNLAVAALTAAVELALLPTASWAPALFSLMVWLLVQSATALFFFSFASFCAMFTGHILALPIFYGILNFLCLALNFLINALLEQFFFGYTSSGLGDSLAWYCTPAAALDDACFWRCELSAAPWDGRFNSPSHIAAYAGVGLLLALLALWVYRGRHAESAGDVVSVPLVRPLFKYGVAFCSGLTFGTFTAAFFGVAGNPLALTLFLLAWSAAGYFVAEMFLQKSFRVLRAWKGCAVMTAVLALLCLSCFLDLFGVSTRVPRADSVISVRVTGNLGYPLGSSLQEIFYSEEDPELVQIILDLHQAIVDDRDRSDSGRLQYVSGPEGDDSFTLDLSYVLQGGNTLSRHYYSLPLRKAELNQEGSITWAANQLLQQRQLFYDFDFYEAKNGRLVEADLENVCDSQTGSSWENLPLDTVTQQELMDLWRAVRLDFDEGTIGTRYLFDDEERAKNTYVTDLWFHWHQDGMKEGHTIAMCVTLTPNARRTLAWFEEYDILADRYQLVPHTQSGGGGWTTVQAGGGGSEVVP